MKISIDQAFQQALSAHKAGKLKEAEKIYSAILEASPNHLATHSNIGVMFYKLGRLDEAEFSYRKLIKLKPKNAEAYCNLGVILQQLDKLEESESCCKKAIELKPVYALAYNNLGNILKKLGKFEDSEKAYKTAIKLKSDYVEAYYNLSVLFQEIDKLKDSELNCKEVIKLNPKYAEAYNNLGITLQKLGKIESAEINYQKAIDFKPNYIKAHFNLSQIKNFKKNDKQLDQMQSLYLDQNITDDERCHLGFALGKAFEELNLIEKSFNYYLEGNTVRRKSLNYDPQHDTELFDQIKKTYSVIKKNSFKISNLSNEKKFIFILGMPRSGTTLIEQIISSHSEVRGAGELTFIEQFGDAIARGKSKINYNILMGFRQNYLKKLNELSNNNFIITDKMTINFRYIGLICSAFPEAKIVHTRRDPAATCWGNYKQLFSNKKSFHYCYDLKDVVNYYRLYQDLMKFWEDECGDRIYNLDYESFTVHQEDETKKLIKFLGLTWEEKCLAPQDNNRSISTASSKQIRQKIYQGSSQKWKKFHPYLNGVFDTLNN
jgi:Flp pilus assembly protein TadD